jgi:hypothetical protein
MLLAPQKDCAKTKRKWHRPWCGDDTCMLGWGVGMHRAMVWAIAADHHGAAEVWSGFATEATIGLGKYRRCMVHLYVRQTITKWALQDSA